MRTFWIITATLILGCGGANGTNEETSMEMEPIEDTGGSTEATGASGKSADQLRQEYEAKYEPACAAMHAPAETEAQKLVIQGAGADVKVKRGKLEKEQVQQVVGAQRDDLRTCYQGMEAWYPGAEGTLTIRFGIDPEGKVIRVKVLGNELDIRTLGCCVADAIRDWRFPPPENDGYVIVTYPFEMDPTLAL